MESSKLENQRYVKIAIIGAIILISAIIVVRFGTDIFEESPYPGVGKLGTDHQHARFAVYLENDRVSFSPVLYKKYRDANAYILLEYGDGNTIHRFADGATLDIFFDSFGMEFSKDCFKLDPDDTVNVHNKQVFRAEYCNDGDKTIRLYVDDELNDEFENYVIWEYDRVLVTYGNETGNKLDKQINMLYRGRGPGLALGGGGFPPPPP